jgi:hypothetical protein
MHSGEVQALTPIIGSALLCLTPSEGRRRAMQVTQVMDGQVSDFLRTVYELAGRKAKRAVSYGEVRTELGHSEDEAERACDFWADRGVLEWTTLGHICLTYVGLRRAERLARRGWSFAPF